MAYSGPNAAEVRDLVAALEGLPTPLLVHLARFYGPDDQAARDRAWDEVREAVEFWNRRGGLDEIRATAIDIVTIRHAADRVYLTGEVGQSSVVADRPEDQARAVNAIIEAAGATLVRDRITDDAYGLLAGPVLDLLDATEEAAGDATEDAERRRRDPHGLAGQD